MRSLVAEWPIISVLTGIVVAMAFVALDRFRVGSVLLAVSVAVAFFLRLWLPEERAGMLAVRTRRVDLTVLGVLAGGLVVLSLWVPPPG